jgi:hypothetical protein
LSTIPVAAARVDARGGGEDGEDQCSDLRSEG